MAKKAKSEFVEQILRSMHVGYRERHYQKVNPEDISLVVFKEVDLKTLNFLANHICIFCNFEAAELTEGFCKECREDTISFTFEGFAIEQQQKLIIDFLTVAEDFLQASGSDEDDKNLENAYERFNQIISLHPLLALRWRVQRGLLAWRGFSPGSEFRLKNNGTLEVKMNSLPVRGMPLFVPIFGQVAEDVQTLEWLKEEYFTEEGQDRAASVSLIPAK